MLNSDVKPLDNIHCRKAVLYAADHEGYQRAYGGPVGGDIATNLMPPLVAGAQKFDDYGFETDKNGNLDKAKAELTAVRHAERLQHQHQLPRGPAEGEGHRGVAAAVAEAGRHQPDHQALPDR